MICEGICLIRYWIIEPWLRIDLQGLVDISSLPDLTKPPKLPIPPIPPNLQTRSQK